MARSQFAANLCRFIFVLSAGISPLHGETCSNTLSRIGITANFQAFVSIFAYHTEVYTELGVRKVSLRKGDFLDSSWEQTLIHYMISDAFLGIGGSKYVYGILSY